mmetsp:Transcript_28237/g.59303  ORF Transcript_28237/g.59303 Transcript_28237/m.59303 type:complete len:252 (-) Transcript_28237:685-1440(-)
MPPDRESTQATTFQRAVAASLARRYPLSLAREGDNVGLTVAALREVDRGNSAAIMLCVDLTEQVLCEALAIHAAFVITYFPMPSHPIRSLSTADVTGRILLNCAQHNLAVYSVHSACDHAPGGINDWLAKSLAPGRSRPIVPDVNMPDAGLGRLLECEEFCFVKTVAVQVGEAAAVLQNIAADVMIASEMSHSDIIAANAKGIVVILAGQSTIERGYLGYLSQQLQEEFADSDWNVKVKCSQIDGNPLAVV